MKTFPATRPYGSFRVYGIWLDKTGEYMKDASTGYVSFLFFDKKIDAIKFAKRLNFKKIKYQISTIKIW